MERTPSTKGSAPALTTVAAQAGPHERWNFAALTAEGTLLMLALSFVDSSTVLPVFVSTFTSSQVAIGLIAAGRVGGWLLPQMIGANLVQHRPRKKPFLVTIAFLSRGIFLAIGTLTMLFGAHRPGLVLSSFFVLLWLFYLIDGLGGVAYFDLAAKAIRPTNRGKLWGMMQMLGGPAAVGAGLIVRWALGNNGPSYPANYALLFFAAGAAAALSAFAFTLMREPIGQMSMERVGLLRYLSEMPSQLRRNALLRRLVMVQLVGTFGEMALPFYIVFARERLGFPDATVGYFVATQMVGTVVLGMLWGYGCDRLGNRFMIRATLGSGAAVPGIALVIALLNTRVAGLDLYVFILIFLLVGGILAWSTRLVYVNLLMEAVSAEQRPSSVGLLNTLNAPLMFAPIVGGLIAAATSYTVLFAVACVFPLIGLLLSAGLPEPRHVHRGATTPPH